MSYNDQEKRIKFIFCYRVHVVCLVRGDVLELLDLQ